MSYYPPGYIPPPPPPAPYPYPYVAGYPPSAPPAIPVFAPPPVPVAPPPSQREAEKTSRLAVQIFAAVAVAIGMTGLTLAICFASPELLVASLAITLLASVGLATASPGNWSFALNGLWIPFQLSHWNWHASPLESPLLP